MSMEELQLATRNHGLPLEALRYSGADGTGYWSRFSRITHNDSFVRCSSDCSDPFCRRHQGSHTLVPGIGATEVPGIGATDSGRPQQPFQRTRINWPQVEGDISLCSTSPVPPGSHPRRLVTYD